MVSVIVACYNQGKYIAETLDTILLQSYQDWECIVINDGSTDNTEEVVKVYMQRDKRIKYISQKNEGVCVARNVAIEYSLGEYILCLDADDKISTDYVRLCVNELEKDKDVTLVTTNYQYFGKNHKTVVLEPYSIERLMGHNLFINCSMFRRIDYDRVGGFNLNMKNGLEDWDFWLSILSHNGKVKYLDGVHFFYRIKTKKESRNISVALDNYDMLRKQIWENHKDLYSSIYSSPILSLEYMLVANSKEYLLGKIFLKPFRLIQEYINR